MNNQKTQNRFQKLQSIAMLLLLLFTTQNVISQDVSATERQALIDLYNATDGPNWTINTNWNTSEPVYTWYGVTQVEGQQITLDLSANNLSGSIPVELGSAQSLLYTLDFSNNQLTGPIPNEFGNLTGLVDIRLNNNQLTGVIPSQLSDIPFLINLDLHSNQLSGAIPASLSSSLFSFENNKFVFADFESEHVTYQSNLTNYIYSPQSKVDLTESLSVAEGGSITLTSTALTSTNNTYQWYKDGVAITGATSKDYIIANALPADAGVYHFLANNTIVTGLELERNPITLTIDAPVCGVSAAEKQALLDLYNATDGANWTNTLANNQPWDTNIPVCDWFGVIVVDGKVTQVNLPDNNLVGTIPTSMGQLTNLEILLLNTNQLSGNIPELLGNLTSLTYLSVANNNMDGNIPISFSNLTSLQSLFLTSNNFDGIVPFSVVLLPQLNEFTFDQNRYVFSDFEANHNSSFPNLQLYRYAPQAKVDLTESLSIPEGGSITLTTNDLISRSNSYQWYKDGVAITGATSKDYVISNASSADAGVYHFLANNTIVTGLELERNPITLTIDGSTCGVSAVEKQALLDLYNATDGANWVNTLANNQPWDTNIPVCDWFGVTVTNGNVTALLLFSNNLVGTIPPGVGNLQNLTYLSLPINKLSGNIPPEIGNLQNLNELELLFNQLTGPIPAEIGSLLNLTSLELNSNQLSGPIPPELGNLLQLTHLVLNKNQLTNIPPELGNLQNIKILDLSTNLLSGSIPSELGNITNLTRLHLNNNQLSGSIPLELGNLTNVFYWLALEENQLTGVVPPQLVNLTGLTKLTIDHNKLSGSIPSEFVNLSILNEFSFQQNAFIFNNFEGEHVSYQTNIATYTYSPQAKVDLTESLSVAEGGSITFTSNVLLSPNNTYQWYKDGVPISGATNKDYVITNALAADAGIYHFLANNTIVTGLELERNSITLTIDGPDPCTVPQIERDALIALFNATGGLNWTNNTNWNTAAPVCDWFGITVTNGNVTQLSLQDNNLAGNIPIGLGNLTNLSILYLHFNNLTGSIPIDMGNLSNLNTLFLDRNQLTGTIPPELGNLVSLTFLSLHSNQLTGTIPLELGGLSSLKQLWLFQNQLSGTIPPELGNLQSLLDLNIGGNQLTGEIPKELGNLSSITNLNLAGNQLTFIPLELGNLSTLITLTLTNNKITNIPSELGNLASLKDFRLSDNLIVNIPLELGNLNSVENIDLQRNQITGTIPAELGNLSTLRSLALQGNQLTGEIPATLGNLSELYSLGLTDNQLTGSIPPAIMGLTRLTTLWLSQNQLTGNVPSELSNLINLRNFAINDNQLTGDLPVINSSTISSIHIRNNNFIFSNIESVFSNYQTATGQFTYIPQAKIDVEETIDLVTGNSYTMSISLTSPNNSYQWYKNGTAIAGANQNEYIISNATAADVGDYYCRATNSVVTNLALDRFPIHITVDGSDCPISQTDREALIAFYNTTNGPNWTNNTNWLTDAPICEWYGVGTFGTDVSLNLGNNNLVGTIPSELGNLTSFKILFLGGNQLSGNIPSELGSIPGLKFLTLNNNQLSGTIPDLTNTSTVVTLNNNNFVFSDLEQEFVNNTTNIPNFTYIPQAKVDLTENLSVLEGGSITLTSNALTSPNNSYQWFKDGVAISGATSKDYVITSASLLDAGVYHFEATNSIVTGLTLIRNDITLTVGPGTPQFIQTFCTMNGTPIVADLTAIITDSAPLWYLEETGGTPLDENEPLITGVYYQDISGNNLPERVLVQVFVDLDIPIGEAEQSFDFTTNPTLADIVVQGASISPDVVWYSSITSTDVLPMNTPLVAGQSYFALSFLERAECRLQVTVNDINTGGDCIDSLSEIVDGSFEAASIVVVNGRNETLGTTGWVTGQGTPDTFLPPLNNTTDPYMLYNFNSSPNGGVCAGALKVGNTTESFYTDVTGLIPGQTYVVEFYQANATNLLLSQLFEEAYGSWQIQFGDEDKTSERIEPVSTPVWGRAKLEFTVTNATQRIEFTAASSATVSNNAYPVYMLIDGIRIYKKQTSVTVGCYDIDTQSFCSSDDIEPTIADLISPLSGTTSWYNEPIGGIQYSDSDELVDLNSYFFWADNGSGNRVPLEVIFDLGAPEGDDYQSFEIFQNPTIADLQVTGTNITWYDSTISTTPLATTTVLVSDTIYYAAQDNNPCRLAVEVFVGVLSPIGDGFQEFCSSDNPTIANLVMEVTNSGYSLVWFDAETGGTAYNDTDLLVDGTTYYVAQTDGTNITEERYPVTVSIIDVDAQATIYERDIAVSQGETIATLTAFFQLDSAIVWYDIANGGTAYRDTDELVEGETYYAQIGEGLCSALEVLAVTVHIEEVVAPELITCIKFVPQPGDRYVISGWAREDALIAESSEIRNFSDVSDVFVDLLEYLKVKVLAQESIPNVYVLKSDPNAPNVDALVPYIKNSTAKNVTVYNFENVKENTDGINRTIGFTFSLDPDNTYKFTYMTPKVRWTIPLIPVVIKDYHYPMLNNDPTITFKNVSVCGTNFCINSDFSIAGGDNAYLSTSLTNEQSEGSTLSGIESSVEFFTYRDDPDHQVMEYLNTSIELTYKDIDGVVMPLDSRDVIFRPKGAVIDGWQRISTDFTIPLDAANITITLKNTGEGLNAYFDDVRMHPFNSNMKSFVYDPITQRLQAELDENNYATFYEYDSEGGLVRVKKETERGVYTIQETRSGNSKLNN